MDENLARRLLGNLIGGEGTAGIGAENNSIPAFVKIDQSAIRNLKPASRSGFPTAKAVKVLASAPSRAGGLAGLVGGTQSASAAISKASNGIFAGAASAPTKGEIVRAQLPEGFTQEESFVDGPNGEIYSIVATGPDPVCTPAGFANARASCTVSGSDRGFEPPRVEAFLEDELGRELISRIEVPPRRRGFCGVDFRKTPSIRCGLVPFRGKA